MGDRSVQPTWMNIPVDHIPSLPFTLVRRYFIEHLYVLLTWERKHWVTLLWLHNFFFNRTETTGWRRTWNCQKKQCRISHRLASLFRKRAFSSLIRQIISVRRQKTTQHPFKVYLERMLPSINVASWVWFRPWHLMWVNCVGSALCYERFFPRYFDIPLSLTPKFDLLWFSLISRAPTARLSQLSLN